MFINFHYKHPDAMTEGCQDVEFTQTAQVNEHGFFVPFQSPRCVHCGCDALLVETEKVGG